MMEKGKADTTYVYGHEEGYQIVPSLSSANLIIVSFAPYINGIPVVPTESPEKGSVFVSILIDGTIVSIDDYRERTVDLTSQSNTYPLKTLDQAKIDLRAQKGALLSVSQEGEYFSSGAVPPQVTELTIHKAFLAYYVDTSTNSLTPVYVFQGRIVGQNNITYTASVFLVAVQENAYSKETLTQQLRTWIAKRVPYEKEGLYSITYSENKDQFMVTLPASKSEQAKSEALAWFKEQGAEDPEKQLNIYFFLVKN